MEVGTWCEPWCSATRLNVRRHGDRGLRINSLVPNPLATVVVQSSKRRIFHLELETRRPSPLAENHEAVGCVVLPPGPCRGPAGEERPVEGQQHGSDGRSDEDRVRAEERRGLLHEVQGPQPPRPDLPQGQLQGKCRLRIDRWFVDSYSFSNRNGTIQRSSRYLSSCRKLSNRRTNRFNKLGKPQVSETVEVTRNSYPVEEVSGRSSEGSFLDNVQAYLTSHDVTFKLPMDSSVKVSARNIEDDQLTFDVKFGQGRAVEEARKSKLKKVVIPILVFVLLKAMTLIPLAIGVLGLKAWNALQLSFFSFIVSVGMAIFQLCKKIAADSHGASLTAHGPWEYQAQYRSLDEQPSPDFAQDLAYSAHAQS